MMVMNLTEYAQEVEVWLDDHVVFQTALAGMVGNKDTHHFENIPAMSFLFFFGCVRKRGSKRIKFFPSENPQV